MTAFLEQVLAFPTVFLSAGLTIVVIYWGFVIAGALDIDTFDLDLDLDLDGAADGAVEGGAESAGEAAEAAEGVQSGFGLLGTLGLRRAPFTVTFSLLLLAAWVFCVLGMQYVAPLLGMLPSVVVSGAIFAASLLLAVPVTSISSRPLGPLFITHEADGRSDLIGRTCRIDTGTVDGVFGQATIEENGGWTVIQVRNPNANAMQRGDEALIIAYDDGLEAFRVEPMQHRDDEASRASTAQTRATPSREPAR